MRPSQLLEQARERFAVDDYYGAIHLLEDLVASGRAFADAHHLLGLCYYMIGQRERALEAVDRALKLNPRYLEALMHRGVVLSALGHPEEAQAAFVAARTAVAGDRGGMPAHHADKLANQHAALGDAYVDAGALGRGIEQYQAALRLGPTFQDLRYRLARLLLEAGRALEAREELEKLVAARPQSAEARAALGLACYLAGDVPSARDLWAALAKDRPADARVRAYLAMLERAPE
ncbi:MAG: tetratricopeptide repeat protein [Gemmatimonadetes bacterium]|nr:tetratricopeptide repeat protein [Gemmatimonadota bacterium]